MKTYSIARINIFMFSSLQRPLLLVLKDAEDDANAADVFAYFEQGRETLEQKLKTLKNRKRPLTRTEAEELRLILNTLISTKGVVGQKKYRQNN